MKKRNPLQIFKSVIFALLVRELKTRFSSTKNGYFFALVEPLSHIVVLSFIFYLIKKTEYFGIHISVFIAVSIIPWIYFNNTVKKITNSFEANSSLFLYKQVKPIDTIVSRQIIEFLLIFFVSISLYVIGVFFGFEINIKNMWEVIIISFAIIFFFFSFAFFLALLFFFFKNSEQIYQIIMKPVYFLSAIFYPVSIVPTEYQFIFIYNPIANSIELLRYAFFEEIKYCHGNIFYILLLGVIFLFLSLTIYRYFEYKILETR